MKSTKLLCLSACILAFASCKSQYEIILTGSDSDAKFDAAFDYFNSGKYSKSSALFESLASIPSGTSRDDTVQYYWALSNYRFKDYYTAETNFNSFLVNYPRSPFAQDARYYRIDCLYRSTLRWELDQKPTNSAIGAIQEYIRQYPSSPYTAVCENMLADLNERLDRKAYEGARLYYKMEDYKAASVALKNVLKADADNIYREDILYHIAMSSYKYSSMSVDSKKKERYLVFVDDYLNFIGEYPESHYRRELNGMYRRAQQFLGKSPALLAADPEEETETEK